MHAHRVCDLPKGLEEATSVAGDTRRAYEAQGRVICLTNGTYIMITFGRNFAKLVNLALEGPHVCSDPVHETLLLSDDTTGAALVTQSTGDISTALMRDYGASQE